jgi:acetyltransferase-like isoleucine patch superfamily enzyme
VKILNYIYRLIRFIINNTVDLTSQFVGLMLFKANRIKFKKGVIFNGIPKLHIQGKFRIGENFKMNNRISANPIGRSYKCTFVVRKGASMIIGDNVGMSGTTIVSQKKITIGNNVKFGGNVCVYDTDFHSLDAIQRRDLIIDKENVVKKEVRINNDAFIGAHSTILKGVTIGRGSIIGACSVVTKDVPDYEIWAGNPVKFIRKI